MSKLIDLKLTSIFSPICQTLIHETDKSKLSESNQKLINNCEELLVIRFDRTVIGYANFELIDGQELILGPIHFRSTMKDRALGEYWISRLIKRRLKNITYNQFLLAS